MRAAELVEMWMITQAADEIAAGWHAGTIASWAMVECESGTGGERFCGQALGLLYVGQREDP